MKRSEESRASLYFLAIAVAITVIAWFVKPDAIIPTLKFLWGIVQKIVPVLVLVFVFLVIVNWFITPKMLLKYLGKEAGMKGWLIAIGTGIISSGPIYMWYPLLQDLQKRGVRNGFIATFLYNRAIKPALLPLMIYYFGIIYTLVLTVVMAAVSVFQGVVVEKFIGVKK